MEGVFRRSVKDMGRSADAELPGLDGYLSISMRPDPDRRIGKQFRDFGKHMNRPNSINTKVFASDFQEYWEDIGTREGLI